MLICFPEKTVCNFTSGGNMQKTFFNKNIHGLRGVAVMFVFLFHVYTIAIVNGSVLPHGFAWLDQVLSTLASGVDIFFMISGYLITASLMRHKNAKNFLIDRFIRIYPVFLAVVCPLFVLEPLLHQQWTVGLTTWDLGYAFVTNILMMPGIFPIMRILGPAWSLSYELLFYYLAATLYFFWSRKNKAVAILILALCAPILLYFYPRMIGFISGALVYYVTQVRSKQETRSGHLHAIWSSGKAANTLKRLMPSLAVLTGVLYLSILSFTFTAHFSGFAGGPRNWLGNIATAQGTLLTYCAFPLGAFFFFNVVNGTKLFNKIFQVAFLQRMGTISYSFYLWHWLVFSLLKPVLVIIEARTDAFGGMLLSGLLVFLVTYIIASISYQLLEKRAGTLLKKVLWPKPVAISIN
jgi:peptidoglycan/LPS O-acetylase OafA/YrhL